MHDSRIPDVVVVVAVRVVMIINHGMMVAVKENDEIGMTTTTRHCNKTCLNVHPSSPHQFDNQRSHHDTMWLPTWRHSCSANQQQHGMLLHTGVVVVDTGDGGGGGAVDARDCQGGSNRQSLPLPYGPWIDRNNREHVSRNRTT